MPRTPTPQGTGTGRRPDVVILDLDDTLFDHGTSARRGALRFLRAIGLPSTRELAELWESTAAEAADPRFAGAPGRTAYRRSRVVRLLREAGHVAAAEISADPQAVDQFYDLYLRAYETEWVPFPDAIPALRRLRGSGYRLAVLTNGPERRQRRKLRTIGAEPLVEALFTSEGIGGRKPDPRTYRAACRGLGVRPEQALHVGDDVELDLQGALRAGLPAIHLDRTGAPARRADVAGDLLELATTL